GNRSDARLVADRVNGSGNSDGGLIVIRAGRRILGVKGRTDRYAVDNQVTTGKGAGGRFTDHATVAAAESTHLQTSIGIDVTRGGIQRDGRAVFGHQGKGTRISLGRTDTKVGCSRTVFDDNVTAVIRDQRDTLRRVGCDLCTNTSLSRFLV